MKRTTSTNKRRRFCRTRWARQVTELLVLVAIFAMLVLMHRGGAIGNWNSVLVTGGPDAHVVV